jgi:inorganic pyrophosphatase
MVVEIPRWTNAKLEVSLDMIIATEWSAYHNTLDLKG